jgi:hypothetical protein
MNMVLANRLATAAALLLLAAGCSGGGGDGTTNPPPPPPATGNFTLSITGGPITLARSTSGSVTVNVTRTGTFSEVVTLSVSGVPTGVTSGLNPGQVFTGAATSAVNLNVGGTAAAGSYTITVTGSATGVSNQVVTFQLIVTTPPAQTGPFTLSISATSYLVHPNDQLAYSPMITIARNAGFTGSVAFTVAGLPATLFIGFTPSTTTGNTTTAIVLNAGAPNGTYTATIRGASSQGDQTVTLQVVVAPPSTGSIKWKFCSSSLPRYFVAVRDGNGPWTRLMPAADTSFSFNVTSATAALAEVHLDSGGFRTTVHQFTAQEMAARAASQCALVQNGSSRTANGSFGGVTGFRTSQVGMGWWFGSANGNGNYTLLNLPAGPLDVVAVRNGEINLQVWAIPVDRMIIRRGQNPASGATMPVLNFGAAESFAPTQATWGFGNRNGEQFSVSQMFTTAGGSTGIFTAIPAVDGPDSARTVYGVPLAQTLAGDLHQVIATVATTGPSANSPLRALRQIVAYARTLGDRTLAFGPPMPAANVSAITTAPLGRLRAQGTLPAEYNSGVTFDITQTSTARFFTIHATRGFLGAGNAYDLQMPDLSGAIGWDTQFAIRAGVPTNWWVNGGGALDFFDGRYIFNSTRSRWTGIMTGIVAPADGATYLSARTVGTTVP